MGIMMMTLVFKIPGMLGAGSMYEGFLSTITFALAAAKMAGAIATGGPGGMAAVMGGSSPGGSPSGLMTSAGQSVGTGPGAMAANMMTGLGNTARSVGSGLLRGGSEIVGGGGGGGGSSRSDVASGEPPTPSGPSPAVGQAAQSFSAPGASVLSRGFTGKGFEGKATGNGRPAMGMVGEPPSPLAEGDRALPYSRASSGAQEAKGGQIGDDYRAAVSGVSNPFSPSGQRFSEAAADYNKMSVDNPDAFNAMQGNVRATELDDGGVRLQPMDDAGNQGAPRDLPEGHDAGDYIKNEVGVDRFNNASRLNAAMDGDDAGVTGRGMEVGGRDTSPHGYEAPGYQDGDSRTHVDESNMAQVWATQKQGEDAGVKISDRGESISTPDGGAGTAENAVRYDREQGTMRSLNDAEKDHVYGKVGADGERSGGLQGGVNGFNQSLQGVTSNNALSRGEVGSLARNSGMSRSESKHFAKELTSSKVGSEVNGRGQLRVGPGHYMRPTAKQRAFIDSVGGASSFNQQFSAKHGLSNKNAASTTGAPAAVSSGPGGFDGFRQSVKSRAGAGWQAGRAGFAESQAKADNKQVMLVRDHAGRTSVGSDALQQVNRTHGSKAGFTDAMSKKLEYGGGGNQMLNVETGRLTSLSEGDRRAEFVFRNHGQSPDQAAASLEAAKTGPSVQTIATDSKALGAEMDKGEVNVVALNADGTHEFRHANDAEMERMSALRSSDESGFTNQFNDLHKGQFAYANEVGPKDAEGGQQRNGWVKEEGVMRQMNDFERGVVADHGAGTFNAAFRQVQGNAGVGYVQDRTMQQRMEMTMDERREETRQVREKVSNAAGQVGGAAGRVGDAARNREMARTQRSERLGRLNTEYAPQSTRSGSESVQRGAAAI